MQQPPNPTNEAPETEEEYYNKLGKGKGRGSRQPAYDDDEKKQTPMQRVMQVVMMVAVSAIVTFGLNIYLFQNASQSYVDSATQTMATTVGSHTTLINSLQGTITDLSRQISAINQNANGATSTQVTALSNSLNALQSTVQGIQQKADTANTQVASLQKQIDTINAKIATMTVAPSPTTTATATTTSGYSSTYNNITATIVSSNPFATSGLTQLAFPVPTATGGGVTAIAITNGGSGYINGSTVNIILGNGTGATATVTTTNTSAPSAISYVTIATTGTGYSAGSATLIPTNGIGTGAVGAITASAIVSSSSSQSFTLKIANSSNTTASAVQMALGFVLVDGSGNPLTVMPSWFTYANVAVTTGGFGSGWAYSSTIAPNMLVYTTSSTTNVFGFGSFNQAGNSNTTYTVTATITNSTQNAATIYMIPMIKVVSYS